MAQEQTYIYNVRFPSEMQEQMQQAAEEQRRSLNGLIVRAVEIYLQEHDRRRGRNNHGAQEAE